MHPNNNRKINLHIYPTAFVHETRILKETSSLARSGIFSHIYIAATAKAGLPFIEAIDKQRTVYRIKSVFKSVANNPIIKAIKFVEWSSKVFFQFVRMPIAVVSCHCLAVLPLGVCLKLFKGSKLIYETHELETERNGWGKLKTHLAKTLEKLLFKFVNHTVVVGPSIAKWYIREYNTDKVATVRNIPSQSDFSPNNSSILKDHFNISSEEILFLYQGVLNRGRGIELLLNAFSKVDSKKHIVFMGYGPLESNIKDFSAKHRNIHHYPAVSPTELANYTQGADVGFAVFENTSLSYYYSCPNKLFEYILGGVVPVVSDFPDMVEIIERYKCGWKVKVDETSITQLVNSITKEDITQHSHSARLAKPCLSWENEEKTLLELYKNII